MRKFIVVSFVAAAMFACAPLWAQTQVTGQGSETVTETTEPPPRTIIPEKPTTPAKPAEPKPAAKSHSAPKSYSTPKSYSGQGYSGYGSVKCDLPGACDEAAPAGAVTLEQLDARKGGASKPAPVQAPAYVAPAPVPAPAPAPAKVAVPVPAPAKATAQAQERGSIYESSGDKPVVLRHYIPGVSDKMPVYPGSSRAPAPAPTYPAPVPAPAPAPAPAPKIAAPAPLPAPQAMPTPPASYGAPKSDLPGYVPEPVPQGAVRLEDVKAPQSGHVPQSKKTAPPPAVSPAPVKQVDDFEQVGAPDSDLDVQKPPSRWK